MTVLLKIPIYTCVLCITYYASIKGRRGIIGTDLCVYAYIGVVQRCSNWRLNSETGSNATVQAEGEEAGAVDD